MLARQAACAAVMVAAIGPALILPVLSGGEDGAQPRAAAPSMGADWAFRPRDVRELAAASAAAVQATVERIEPGAPLVTEGEPDVAPIPTQRIHFRVEERWFGDPGETFVLFKTGSQEAWIENDPPYEVGSTHALFVRPRAGDDTWLPVAPDGRFAIKESRLEAVIDGPATARLHGKSKAEAKADARSAKRGG